MAVGVPPWLKVIADEHAVETALLGRYREIEQRARTELFSRRFVTEPQLRFQPSALEIAIPAEADAARRRSHQDDAERDE